MLGKVQPEFVRLMGWLVNLCPLGTMPWLAGVGKGLRKGLFLRQKGAWKLVGRHYKKEGWCLRELRLLVVK